jgi:hypothetical protein
MLPDNNLAAFLKLCSPPSLNIRVYVYDCMEDNIQRKGM